MGLSLEKKFRLSKRQSDRPRYQIISLHWRVLQRLVSFVICFLLGRIIHLCIGIIGSSKASTSSSSAGRLKYYSSLKHVGMIGEHNESQWSRDWTSV